MKLTIQLLFLGLLLALSPKSLALTCLKNATDVSDQISMDTTVAVPIALPKDTILWRSPNYSVNISCWANQFWNAEEEIYFYLSPKDPGLSMIGPDLEVGLNLDGKDIRCTQVDRCRIKLPHKTLPCRSNAPGGCPHLKTNFTLHYNFFISKRSLPGTSKEGPIAGHDSYVIFQLDGVGGPIANNFRMVLNGLNQLRYVACSSTLSISPKTLDFGLLQALQAATNQTIKEKPFQITASKNCNSAYGLGALLRPVNSSSTVGDTLVPGDNKSVGITVLRQEDRSIVPFNKEFQLVEHSKDQVVVKNFLAQLKWMTNAPTLGRFNATAAIDIYYK
ncbi:TPA: fimbrial protein [Pseudomonas aeruginosa]|uniref:fimbrial protein n=1 Tax=Pseudomonas TaxID=286 RepID=UPI0003BB12A6|nr:MULTISPECIES: fimbrial protein [Pseudomonas]EIU2714422.1 fimbrial protein [Pseudomonas aeruginosa]EIU2859532.1 fimbrial protein [Pseudomonas aeruginosa]EKF8202878.1 fimbrial protein [Pseudomonas aeruginosa]EKI0126376.1 fimbrial protein [Pseudomonas aeruginosa]EKJ8725455.1 fimbrial protein [Pseudomonas aeruginosa]